MQEVAPLSCQNKFWPIIYRPSDNPTQITVLRCLQTCCTFSDSPLQPSRSSRTLKRISDFIIRDSATLLHTSTLTPPPPLLSSPLLIFIAAPPGYSCQIFYFILLKERNLQDFFLLPPSDCGTYKPLNWAIHVLVGRRKRQRWWWWWGGTVRSCQQAF